MLLPWQLCLAGAAVMPKLSLQQNVRQESHRCTQRSLEVYKAFTRPFRLLLCQYVGLVWMCAGASATFTRVKMEIQDSMGELNKREKRYLQSSYSPGHFLLNIGETLTVLSQPWRQICVLRQK